MRDQMKKHFEDPYPKNRWLDPIYYAQHRNDPRPEPVSESSPDFIDSIQHRNFSRPEEVKNMLGRTRYQDQPWMDPNYLSSLSPDPVGDAKNMAEETQQQALSFTPAPEENLTPQIGEIPPPPKMPPAIGGMGDNRAIPGMYGASDSSAYAGGRMNPKLQERYDNWRPGDGMLSPNPMSKGPFSDIASYMPKKPPMTPEQREISTGGAYNAHDDFIRNMIGGDRNVWSPDNPTPYDPSRGNPKLGGDPNTWTPEWASGGGEGAKGRITGDNPSVYTKGTGREEPMLGSDPNTWSPTGRNPKLGGDPNTWSPTGRTQVGGTLGNEPSPWDKFEPGYNPYDFNRRR